VTALSPTDFLSSRRKWRVALPVVLTFSLVLARTSGRLLEVLFSAMWLHELGHAATSWACGVFAIPLPWLTLGGTSRSAFFVAIEFSLLGLWFLVRRDHLRLILALAALLVVGLLLPQRKMEALIVFNGDGGAMILGTLLMLGIFLPDDSRLARGGLRWGYLTLGAMGFSATASVWMSARRNADAIPFGNIEGVGLSDPSKLVDEYGWSEGQLVRAYVLLAAVCFTVLLVAWAQLFRKGPATTRTP
jgi:hypothetical protein